MKSLLITSGKGGVGKTTTSANVGTGLAMLGEKVVLIDTDIGLRNLDVVMGLENRIVYNLVDVVEGNCRMKQALIKDKRYPNLFLLPSAQTRDKSSVSPEPDEEAGGRPEGRIRFYSSGLSGRASSRALRTPLPGADRALCGHYAGGFCHP